MTAENSRPSSAAAAGRCTFGALMIPPDRCTCAPARLKGHGGTWVAPQSLHCGRRVYSGLALEYRQLPIHVYRFSTAYAATDVVPRVRRNTDKRRATPAKPCASTSGM